MGFLNYSRRFRAFWWRPSVGDEVDDELEFHVAMRARELEARGMPAAQAREAARARLGDGRRLRADLRRLGRERNRSMRRTSWLADLRHDIRFGVRSLAKARGFTLVAGLTLALGIGGTTAIFSAVYSVVLRPLPIPEPERVFVLGFDANTGPRDDTSIGNYVDLEREQTHFSALAAMSWSNFNLADADAPERVLGGRATWNLFSVFGIAPLLGRLPTEADDRAGAAPVVVLSHRLWSRRFGADSGIVGRPIRLNGVGHTVIGVMPKRFDFTTTSEELWVPAAWTPEQRAQHDEHYLTAYGRLRPGVAAEEARRALERTMLPLVEQYPFANGGIVGVRLQPLQEQFVGSAAEQLLVLLGAVGFVLLIACVNVANLLVARGATREREMAVRASLGAGRGRIVRQMVTENLLLGLGAGLVGVLLAYGALQGLLAASPQDVPRLEQAAIDLPTLAFALGVSVLSTLLFGLGPALSGARRDLQQALRDGGRGAVGSSGDWLRRSLVSIEVAIAIVLLVGTGLLIRTSLHLQRVDPGFDPAGVLTARVTLPRDGYLEYDRVTQTFSRMADELRAAPGVTAAGLSSQVPMGPGGGSNGLIPEGRPLEIESAISTRMRLVTPGYLAAMRIPLVAGRDFTTDDRAGTPRVMIVSEAFARQAWPGESPLGKRVICCEGSEDDPRWKEVVGVTREVRAAGLDQDVVPEFYLPVAQAPASAWDWIQRSVTLAARGSGTTSELAGAMRRAVAAIDPGLPLYGLASMDERVARSLARSRFNTGLLTLLGGLGLGLAAIGIYGVIAYFVTRRTREIGVRMALGASAASIARLVLRQGMFPVVVGTAAGIGAALLLTRVLESQLHGVQRTDPLTFAAVVLVAMAVAGSATLGPIRRATRTDTVVAMREE